MTDKERTFLKGLGEAVQGAMREYIGDKEYDEVETMDMRAQAVRVVLDLALQEFNCQVAGREEDMCETGCCGEHAGMDIWAKRPRGYNGRIPIHDLDPDYAWANLVSPF